MCTKSDLAHVGGLRALRTLGDFELNTVTLSQGTEAFASYVQKETERKNDWFTAEPFLAWLPNMDEVARTYKCMSGRTLTFAGKPHCSLDNTTGHLPAL